MENEMIERVAKRLMLYDINLPGAGGLRGTLNLRYGVAAELARTVVEAMREPTEAMLLNVADPRNEAQRACFADDWRAMIDAALAPA